MAPHKIGSKSSSNVACLSACAVLASPAFVPSMIPGASLRTSTTSQPVGATSELYPVPQQTQTNSVALLGFVVAGAGALAARAAIAHPRSSKIARLVEPVSAAAAAAAVAKATSAAAGAKTVGASVASAGMVGGDASRPVPEGNAQFDPANEIGVTPPLGFFDPLGFSKKGDVQGFRNLRAAEIKHGRVAMMASMGSVAQHYVKFPGFEGVPAGLAAVTTSPGNLGFAALFAVAGLAETTAWAENADREPGNFGDPAGFGMYDTDTRNREINNGRMAMFATFGILAADLLTGKDGVEQIAASGLSL